MAEAGFDGRAVLVFGAGGALGAGVAAAFAQAGASVTGVDRVEPAGDRRLDGARYLTADVGDDDAVRVLFDAAPVPWAVVNTVGGFAGHRPLAELDLAELAGQVSLNLLTAAVITKHALRVMQPAGQGRIVHTASRAGVVTAGYGFAYSVSKAGVLHLVSMAADEVRGSGITVNCECPASSTPRSTGRPCRTPTTRPGPRSPTSPGPTCTWPVPGPAWSTGPRSRSDPA
jgi:2-dehydro-3-deoxy-L-rhamnonate dehydrogenase (NAD+)